MQFANHTLKADNRNTSNICNRQGDVPCSDCSSLSHYITAPVNPWTLPCLSSLYPGTVTAASILWYCTYTSCSANREEIRYFHWLWHSFRTAMLALSKMHLKHLVACFLILRIYKLYERIRLIVSWELFCFFFCVCLWNYQEPKVNLWLTEKYLLKKK